MEIIPNNSKKSSLPLKLIKIAHVCIDRNCMLNLRRTIVGGGSGLGSRRVGSGTAGVGSGQIIGSWSRIGSGPDPVGSEKLDPGTTLLWTRFRIKPS